MSVFVIRDAPIGHWPSADTDQYKKNWICCVI